MCWRRERTPHIFFIVGEARRRGGGTILATAKEPPKYGVLEACAALGGRIAGCFPRYCITTGNLAPNKGRGVPSFFVSFADWLLRLFINSE